MDTATRNYPAGDLRVSDADRDEALRELSEAFQVGRITADEFDQRCEQVLGARTGNELTVLLADLPDDRGGADTSVPRQACRGFGAWIGIGTAASGAVSLGILAVTNALSRPPVLSPAAELLKRRLAQEVLARMGLKVPLPPPSAAPGFDWAGTITPAAIAVLLVAVIVVVLSVARTSCREPR